MEFAHLPPRPRSFSQFPDFDSDPCFLAKEDFGAAGLDSDWGLVQIRLRDEVVPVDIHCAFIGTCSPCDESDPIAKFVDGESAESFFAQRQASEFVCPALCRPLLPTVVVARHQPDRPQQVESHALAIIGDNDGRFRVGIKVEGDDSLAGVRVVGVLDQFEDGQPRAADQLVTEQLQHPGPGTEGLAYPLWHIVAQGAFSVLGFTPSVWDGAEIEG